MLPNNKDIEMWGAERPVENPPAFPDFCLILRDL
jgi:hypothetical protein